MTVSGSSGEIWLASQHDQMPFERVDDAPVYEPGTVDLQLLAEIGLVAALKGHVDEARSIFEAIRLWRPKHSIATIGIALAYVADGEFDRAVGLLRPAREADPASVEIAIILLIALTLGGRLDEARPISKMLLNGADGPGRTIAMRLASMVEG